MIFDLFFRLKLKIVMLYFGFYNQCKCVGNSIKWHIFAQHGRTNTMMKSRLPIVRGLSKFTLYAKKLATGSLVISEGFYLVFRHGLYKNPNHPDNTRYVQYFCRRLCQVFNLEIAIHGEIPRQPALWVSNHVSWLDIAVLGSGARVFFLAKAEIEKWPLLGKLAKGGGTLFIKRGSGDSLRIREQIADFLAKDIPVLFFPEATTSDGTAIKKVHGRLLGAAIEAQKPVQICLLCYVNQDGKLDQVSPYVGDVSFAQHVKNVIEMPRVTAHLMALPAIEVTGHTVDSLTKQVHQTMIAGLAELQAKVLT